MFLASSVENFIFEKSWFDFLYTVSKHPLNVEKSEHFI